MLGIKEVVVPRLREGGDDDDVAVKWLVKPGTFVKAGDVIAEAETDKATFEIEALADGVLQDLLAETEIAKVGDVIASIASAQAPTPASAPAAAASQERSAATSPPPPTAKAETAPITKRRGRRSSDTPIADEPSSAKSTPPAQVTDAAQLSSIVKALESEARVHLRWAIASAVVAISSVVTTVSLIIILF